MVFKAKRELRSFQFSAFGFPFGSEPQGRRQLAGLTDGGMNPALSRRRLLGNSARLAAAAFASALMLPNAPTASHFSEPKTAKRFSKSAQGPTSSLQRCDSSCSDFQRAYGCSVVKPGTTR